MMPPSAGSRLVGQLPTGAKMFLILSAALLPLAVIAFFASLKLTQLGDEGARGQLRIASFGGAQALGDELIGDVNALRTAANALAADPGNDTSCARISAVFARQIRAGVTFEIGDQRLHLLCGTAGVAAGGIRRWQHWPGLGNVISSVAPTGLTLSIATKRHSTHASAFFPVTVIARIARPAHLDRPFDQRLDTGRDRLILAALPDRQALERRESVGLRLGLADLVLHTSVRSAPIGSPLVIALLLPILMWAAAAGIGWFVVDRLLIQPLRRLQDSVAGYRPGEEIDPGEVHALPAQEIRELGETFRAISRTVAEHEAGLAAGLLRQTRLTREVHHRVKNNLQVISSLINFHARGARTAEASQAYASIQRRVDALSVVHRNHFAELEETRGLSLRSVVGELASNIRATAPETAALLVISIEIGPYLVSQDVAIAVAFLITELVELAMTIDQGARVRIAVEPESAANRAMLDVSSTALRDGAALRTLMAERYGRVVEGLSRQLRTKLIHEPELGSYRISLPITGSD